MNDMEKPGNDGVTRREVVQGAGSAAAGGVMGGIGRMLGKLAGGAGAEAVATVSAAGILTMIGAQYEPAEAKPERGRPLDSLGLVVKCLFDTKSTGLMAGLQRVEGGGKPETGVCRDKQVWAAFPQLTKLGVERLLFEISKPSPWDNNLIEVTAFSGPEKSGPIITTITGEKKQYGEPVCYGAMRSKKTPRA